MDLLQQFRAEKEQTLLDEYRAEKFGGKEVSGAGTQLIRSTGESIIDNILGIPEFFARGAQGAVNLGRAAMGEEMIRRPHGTNILPNPMGIDISGEDLLAGLDSLIEGGTFDENLALQQEGKEQSPIADTIGEGFGTALPMFRVKRQLVESDSVRQMKNLMKQKGDDLARVAATEDTGDSALQFLKVAGAKMATSKTDNIIMKSLGRAAETGLESAFISLMEDSDPAESAMFYAGTQIGGDAVAGLVKGLLKGDINQIGINVATGAFAAGALVQILKTGTPGGVDYILPSLESGFDKVLAAGALSVGFHLAGGGRVKGFTAANAETLADAWTSLRRGTLMSIIEEYDAADLAERDQIEAILNQSMKAPQTAPKPIMDAVQNGTGLLEAFAESGEEGMEWLTAPSSVAAVPVKRRNRGPGFDQ